MANETQRRAAHERLSTGTLSRWTRACASHPWRVVGSWVGIIAVLVVAVGAFGGSLRDEAPYFDVETYLEVTPIIHDGQAFKALETLEVHSPWLGDWALSPSNLVAASRVRGASGSSP